jgi:hypothetical protein
VSDEPNTVEETWRYIGRRASTKGGIGYFWVDAYGVTRGFVKGHHVIGAEYITNVERHPTGEISVHGRQKLVRSINDKLTDEWYVADMAAYTADETRKVEARAKRDRSSWENMTLKEFKTYFKKLPAGQKTGMLNYLIGYFYGS